jgi:hypothetical protein
MSRAEIRTWACGDVIALRYITTDGRIEMCWPCRVVLDSPDLLAVFIAAGSRYKAGPKKTAAEKRAARAAFLPLDEHEWRRDTLRLMLPGQCHSVSLFWDGRDDGRRLLYYFVNMEEPLRRTPIGIDTQDHTLDVVVQPNLKWMWRDEIELGNHVTHGFYTAALAEAVRLEGERAIRAISAGTHPCLNGWSEWQPDSTWPAPAIPNGWDTTPPTSWERRIWAYGGDAFTRLGR